MKLPKELEENVRIIIIALFLFLSGCVVGKKNWEACENLCKPNEGVKWVDVTSTNFHKTCLCNNGLKGDL